MKKFAYLLLIILLGGSIYYYFSKHDDNINTDIIENEDNNDLNPTDNTPKYVDNNPIKVSLYKYYGKNQNRKKITTYNNNWSYHNDISSFEVFYTDEDEIEGSTQQTLFKSYLDKYENINDYKIGYQISFMTNDKEINKTILSPKDSEEFFLYLEIYLYDDYHKEIGKWYSHTTEEEMNNETLLTSIKLTAGQNVSDIKTDIKLTAFTYDNDDFDDNNNYRGISKYSITVENPNK